MFKKLSVTLLAATVMLSGCNIVDVTEVGSVGGTPMSRSLYRYFLTQAQSSVEQQATQEGNTLDSKSKWDSVTLKDGKIASAAAKDMAFDNYKQLLVMVNNAAPYSVEVSGDEFAQKVTQQKNQLIEQFGGRYEFQATLKTVGLSEKDLDTLARYFVISNDVYSAMGTAIDDGRVDIAPIEQRYLDNNKDNVRVKHILISNQPPEAEEAAEGEAEGEPTVEAIEDEQEGEPTEQDGEEAAAPDAVDEPETPEKTPEELEAEQAAEDAAREAEAAAFDAQAKQQADSIIAQLNNGADFESLWLEYKEGDPGQTEDGYIVSRDGSMVKEFEDASFNLDVGAYTTEAVKTSYGYHIIMRYPIEAAGQTYENSKTSLLLENIADQTDVFKNEKAIKEVKIVTTSR